jgi:hypothetical protein
VRQVIDGEQAHATTSWTNEETDVRAVERREAGRPRPHGHGRVSRSGLLPGVARGSWRGPCVFFTRLRATSWRGRVDSSFGVRSDQSYCPQPVVDATFVKSPVAEDEAGAPWHLAHAVDRETLEADSLRGGSGDEDRFIDV